MNTRQTAAFDALDATIRAVAQDLALLSRARNAGLRNWSNGGCAVFAEAVRRWLGPEATLVGVREKGETFLEHIAATWRGLYFDAEGARDKSDFEFDLETI